MLVALLIISIAVVMLIGRGTSHIWNLLLACARRTRHITTALLQLLLLSAIYHPGNCCSIICHPPASTIGVVQGLLIDLNKNKIKVMV